MAKLSRDDVFKLAKLARINLTDDELDSFAEEITNILEYVEQLKNVDVSGLDPTNQVTGLTNVWREDELIDYGYTADDLMKNVPKVKDRYIQVGRMIELVIGLRLVIWQMM
jgi:aspartyl-tRNA(Asn)/glutamyl-tRNA(Gln) amidotransferase subunit C